MLCNATVEERLPRWLQEAGAKKGWVTAEYGMLPRSTHTRTQRETATPQSRTMEIRRLVGRSLRAAVDLSLLGQRQVILDCDVLQADGGTRTAAVTGGYVALALALRRLIQAGEVKPERAGVAGGGGQRGRGGRRADAGPVLRGGLVGARWT